MSFNVRDPQMEQLQRRIANRICSSLPPGWGFSLFLFEFEQPETNCFYISNAERPSMISMIKAWLKRQVQ